MLSKIKKITSCAPLLVLLFSLACPDVPQQPIALAVDFSKIPIRYRIISLEKDPNSIARREKIGVFKKDFEAKAYEDQKKTPDIDFIWAVPGKEVDREPYFLQNSFSRNCLKNGEFGLLLTTFEMIFPFVERGSSDGMTVVLEDDVVFSEDLDAKLRSVLKKVPADWDLLYLGYYLDVFANPRGKVISPSTPMEIMRKHGYTASLCPKSKMVPISESPWLKLTGHCVAGTWAYGIRNSSIQRLKGLIEGMQPIDQPIDELYRLLVEAKKLNAYGLEGTIVDLNYDLPSIIRD